MWNEDPRREGFESILEKLFYYQFACLKSGYLLEKQVRFRKQGRCYRVDLYHRETRIAIEIDGKAYHTSPEQQAYDQGRDQWLRQQCGVRVLRFTGAEVKHQPKQCALKARAMIEQRLAEIEGAA